MLKIVIIGAGSSYTPEIIEGLIERKESLPLSCLSLVDIKEGEEKLNIIYALTKRMFLKAGISLNIEKSLNRREALKGADFVLTQLRVGGIKSRIKDERIPLSFGMIGQETNGLGGFFKALRTIPVMLEIAKDINELAPNAYLINFTNPAGMVSEAVLRFSQVKKVLGLCNIPINSKLMISDVLKEKRENVKVHFQGLNHFNYIDEVYHNGEEVLEKILDKVLENDNFNPKNISAVPWDKDLIKSLKVLPCFYHKYYYMSEEMLKVEIEEFKNNEVRGERVERLEKALFEKYRDESLNVKPKELEERGGANYSYVACELINAIYNDLGSIMTVNTKNMKTISYLPEDAVIEISSLITREKIFPLKSKELKSPMREELILMKAFERLTIDAAIQGCRELALKALLLNPLVKKGSITKVVFNEMLEAHKKYLPQFFK